MSEGGGALRELLISFGVETDTKALEAFEEGLGGVFERVKKYAAGFAGVLALREIKEFFEGTIQQAADLEHLAQRLGVGTTELQQFQFAAKLAGVDAENAGHSLGLLNRQIGEAVMKGGEGAQAFQKLHIPLKTAEGQARQTGDIILDLADRFAEMKSPQERAAYAMQFFGRSGQSLIPILSKGSEELKKTYGELDKLGGLMGEDFIKSAAKAHEETVKFQTAITGIRTRAVNAFLPQITRLIEHLTNWAKKGQEVIETTHALQHALDFLKILGVVKGVMMLVDAMKALAAGEGLVDLLDPFTLMLAAVIALYLVIDDLWTMVEGGDSVIGDALGPDKQEMIDKLRGAFDDVKKTWQEMQPDLAALGRELFNIGVAALPLIAKGFAIMVSLAAKALGIVNKFIDAMKVLGNIGGKGELGGLSDEQYNNAVNLRHNENTGYNLTPEQLETIAKLHPGSGGNPTIREPMAVSYGAPIDVDAAKGKPGSVTVHQTNQINVKVEHKSTDAADEVGQAVGQGVKKETDKALTNALNAGKRK